MLPIFAARAGTIPCQPIPPCMIPETSWRRWGRRVDSSKSPGMRKPWKRTGLNSIRTPVQLISHPIAPVNRGMVASWIHSLVLTLDQRPSHARPRIDAGPGRNIPAG